MSKLVLALQFICFMIISREVRALSLVEVMFTALSDKMDNLDRSFGTRFESINSRLDRIETVVGINGVNSDSGVVKVKDGKENDMTSDLMKAKHTLFKTMAAEKHYIRTLARNLEERFEDMKLDVKSILADLNETIKVSNETLVNKMEQLNNEVNQENQENQDYIDEQITDILIKLNSSDNHATIERHNIISDLRVIQDRATTIEKSQIVQENTINNLDRRIVSSSTSYENTIKNLERRIKTSDNQREVDISSLSNRVTTLHERKVSFTAFLTSKTRYSKGSTILFDSTIHNPNSAYSVSSGKFTTPESGIYLFSVSVEGTSAEKARAVLKDNGFSRMYVSSGKGDSGTSSNTCVLPMYKGDEAWVEAVEYGQFTNGRTTFTGVLLY